MSKEYAILTHSQEQKDLITSMLLKAGFVLYKGFNGFPKTVEAFRRQSPHKDCPYVLFHSNGYIATMFKGTVERENGEYRNYLKLDADKDIRLFKSILKEFLTIQKNKTKGLPFTHKGFRLEVRGVCEKCETKTNWVINVGGRKAYWCGC